MPRPLIAPHRPSLLFLAALLLSLPSLPAPLVLAAGPIAVTTTAPTVAVDGRCSLREALANANADAAVAPDCRAGSGADTVILAPDATYTLFEPDNSADGANGLPSITGTLTISGNGATVQRSPEPETPPFRLLHVQAGASLALHDLTLAHGLARGIDNAPIPGDIAGRGGLQQRTPRPASCRLACQCRRWR